MSNSGGGVGGYYAPHDADEEQDGILINTSTLFHNIRLIFVPTIDIGRRRSDVM
jgi:hypothetical protein